MKKRMWLWCLISLGAVFTVPSYAFYDTGQEESPAIYTIQPEDIMQKGVAQEKAQQAQKQAIEQRLSGVERTETSPGLLQDPLQQEMKKRAAERQQKEQQAKAVAEFQERMEQMREEQPEVYEPEQEVPEDQEAPEEEQAESEQAPVDERETPTVAPEERAPEEKEEKPAPAIKVSEEEKQPPRERPIAKPVQVPVAEADDEGPEVIVRVPAEEEGRPEKIVIEFGAKPEQVPTEEKKEKKPEEEPKKEKKPEVAPAPAEPEPSLLDTIDIEEGGNWVLKRKALQDTVRKIEDINDLYDKIRDTNAIFLQGITTVDTLLHQFGYDIGYDLGQVDQMIHEVHAHLDKERAEEGDLSTQEREVLYKAQEHKQGIDKLRTDVQDVWQAYTQLKEARQLNDEQIIESDRIRKQAWRNFRMIERILNEEKAAQLYQDTVQLYKQMQSTYAYLQQRLIPHFHQLITVIQQKLKEIGAETAQLQKLGILLSTQKDEVEQMEETAKELQGIQEGVVEPKAEPRAGWWASIKRVLWAPFGAVGSLWRWITGGGDDMSEYLPDEPVDESTDQPVETTTA